MPDAILVWPQMVLPPGELAANLVPFSRSGGRSIGGLERSVRTDRGYWSIELRDVPLTSPQRRRTWNAIRSSLIGRAGMIAVPVRSRDSTPLGGASSVPHSDGSSFSDGSQYRQCTVGVEMIETAAIGATQARLRIVYGIADLVGVRFSYEHALYETGAAAEIDGDEWLVPIFPAVRAAIPAGAKLEFDLPTCLCRLATDRAMDAMVGRAEADRVTVSFVEAADHWSDLALEA